MLADSVIIAVTSRRPRWWFNIISQHDWLCALETQHYTAPRRALMLWKTRYHLFILSSFTWWILCLQNMCKSSSGKGNAVVRSLEMCGITLFFFVWKKYRNKMQCLLFIFVKHWCIQFAVYHSALLLWAHISLSYLPLLLITIHVTEVQPPWMCS